MVSTTLISVPLYTLTEYPSTARTIMTEQSESRSVLYRWARRWIMWLTRIYRRARFGCTDITWDSTLTGWDLVSFRWLITMIFQLMWNSPGNWTSKRHRPLRWPDLGRWLHRGSLRLVPPTTSGFIDQRFFDMGEPYGGRTSPRLGCHLSRQGWQVLSFGRRRGEWCGG